MLAFLGPMFDVETGGSRLQNLTPHLPQQTGVGQKWNANSFAKAKAWN